MKDRERERVKCVSNKEREMSKLIQENIHFLLLCSSKKLTILQQKALVKSMDKHQLNSVSEITLNILKGGLDLDSEQSKYLKQFAAKLRIIGSRRSTIAQRRLVLNWNVLHAILVIAQPFLVQLLESIYSKNATQ